MPIKYILDKKICQALKNQGHIFLQKPHTDSITFNDIAGLLRRFAMVSAFIALILIPLCTLLFAGNENWFTTNFSVLGNAIGRQGNLVTWGVLVGGYFYWALYQILLLVPSAPRWSWMISFDLILLFLAVTTPYLPDQFPFQASLHFLFAFFSAVILVLILILLCISLYQTDKRKFRSFLWELTGIILISLYLLIRAGFVTSALEIFFTISCSFFLFRLLRLLQKASSASSSL